MCELPTEFRCLLKSPEYATVDKATAKLFKEALLDLHLFDPEIIPQFRGRFHVQKVNELPAAGVKQIEAWIKDWQKRARDDAAARHQASLKEEKVQEAPTEAPTAPQDSPAEPEGEGDTPPAAEAAEHASVGTKYGSPGLKEEENDLEAALDAAGEVEEPPSFDEGAVCAIGTLPEGTYAVGLKTGKLIRVEGKSGRGPLYVAIKHYSETGKPGVASTMGVKREVEVVPYKNKKRAINAIAAASQAPPSTEMEAPAESVLAEQSDPTAEDVDRDLYPPWRKRWSVSRIGCGLECLRKFWLRYVAEAPDTNPGKALELGKVFHEGVEAINNGSAYDVPELKLGSHDDRLKIRAVLDAYQARPPVQVTAAEVKVTSKLPSGAPMLGYVDGEGGGVLGKTLIEYKYTGMPDNYTLGSLSRQASAYLHAVPDAQAFALVIVEKPKQKRKKGEDDTDFAARLKGALLKKDPFEVRVWERSDFAVDPVIDEMDRGIKWIEDGMLETPKGMLPPANRSIHCGGFMPCSYYHLCEVLDGAYVPETANKGLLFKAMRAVGEAGIDVLADEEE